VSEDMVALGRRRNEAASRGKKALLAPLLTALSNTICTISHKTRWVSGKAVGMMVGAESAWTFPSSSALERRDERLRGVRGGLAPEPGEGVEGALVWLLDEMVCTEEERG
jgi:hypothetical protein